MTGSKPISALHVVNDDNFFLIIEGERDHKDF